MNPDNYDIEKQMPIHRESEGQDTITSLNNNEFIRKLEKLKRQESSRSNTGSQHSLSRDGSLKRSKQSDLNASSSSNVSLRQSTKKVPSSLRSLFRAREIDESSRSINESLEDYLSKQAESQQLLEYQRQTSESNKSAKPFGIKRQVTVASSSDHETTPPIYSRSESRNNQRVKINAAAKANSKTDQVYDALSIILKNSINTDTSLETDFVNKIRKHIAETKSKREKKSNKVKWMCSIAVYLFFFVMFLMVCYFMRTLYVITTNLNNNLAYNYKTSFVYKILPINGTNNIATYLSDQFSKLIHHNNANSSTTPTITIIQTLLESNTTTQQTDFFS